MNILALVAAGILTASEIKIMEHVAKEYQLSQEETRLLFAIRKTENGAQGLEFGIGQGDPGHKARRYKNRSAARSMLVQARWAAGTIKKRYNGRVEEFAKIYCPENAEAWTMMVNYWMKRIERM